MTLSTISDEDLDARFAEIIAAEWPKLTGRQTPEAMLYTPGGSDLGHRAGELGRRSASRIRVLPWQSWSLERIMSRNADGTWTHPECCLIVPRQSGKSLMLVLRVLYGLYKLDERIVFSAQQWETAKALWKRAWHIVKTTPWMHKHVVAKTCSQGRGTIELGSGAMVVFTTRSAHAGRGLDRIDLEIYDEAYDLTEADMAALSPTKMAAADPQTIYTSSAVNAEQHTNGHVLAAVRRRGRRGLEKGLFFAEWMAPEGADRALPTTWERANPSYGVIATERFLEAEFRKFSTAAGRKSFDTEYLGRGDWPPDEDDVEALITAEVWSDLTDREIGLAGPIALALSMTKLAPGKPQMLSIAAAQRTVDDRIHIEVGYHAVPTGAALRIKALIARHSPCALVIDGTDPAISLIPELLAADIEPEKTSAAEKVAACGGFYQDAIDGHLVHTGDPLLEGAVAAAGRREVKGGGWAWQGHRISPLEAATLARWGLLTYGARAMAPALPPAAVRAERTFVQTGDLMAAGF